MGCSSCKNKKGVTVGESDGFVDNVDINNESLFMRIIIFLVKILLFLICFIIVPPIVVPFSLFMLSKIIFMNDSVDVTTGLVNIGRMLKKKDDDDYDDDEDISQYSEDDVTLLDVDDITEEGK